VLVQGKAEGPTGRTGERNGQPLKETRDGELGFRTVGETFEQVENDIGLSGHQFFAELAKIAAGAKQGDTEASRRKVSGDVFDTRPHPLFGTVLGMGGIEHRFIEEHDNVHAQIASRRQACESTFGRGLTIADCGTPAPPVRLAAHE
jgi:hypothetical protein